MRPRPVSVARSPSCGSARARPAPRGRGARASRPGAAREGRRSKPPPVRPGNPPEAEFVSGLRARGETARRPGTRGSRACSSTSSRAPTQPSSISPNVTSACCASACSRRAEVSLTQRPWPGGLRRIVRFGLRRRLFSRACQGVVPARTVRPVSDLTLVEIEAEHGRPPSKGQGAADKAQQGHTPCGTRADPLSATGPARGSEVAG